MNKPKNKFFLEIIKISKKAIKKAKEENRQKGIPNVYCINGKIVFELPDGRLVSEYSL